MSDPHLSGGLKAMGAAFGFMAATGAIVGFATVAVSAWAERASLPRAEATCSGSEECMRKDLIAQVRAAQAAELVADLGLWSLVASAVGLGGLIITLSLNIRATRAAAVAADSAQKSVEIAEKTSKIQLRAYVSAELVKAHGIEDKSEPRFIVNFHNLGQTPAMRVSIETKVVFFPDRSAAGEFHVPHAPDVKRRNVTIGPGRSIQHSTMSQMSMTAEGMTAWKDRKSSFFFCGCVVYDDVFGHTWETRFVHAYDRGKVDGRYHEDGNYMS